jgi:3'-5' exonuclease
MAYGKKEFDFKNHPWESIIFVDIETVKRVKELEEGTPLYDSFFYKMRYAEEAQRKDFSAYNLKALFDQKAALYPEFGKIVCISAGKIVQGKLRTFSFYGHDEHQILHDFNIWLADRASKDPNLVLCGINLKFFDLRFIYIRSVVNGVVPVPKHIDLTGLKPWEVWTADITDYWKQTSPYNAPMVCMAEVLGLPSPKSDMDGSQTSDIYWSEGDKGLERIRQYCEFSDVPTTCNIARRLRFETPLEVWSDKEPQPAEEEPQELNPFQRLYYEGQMSKELHEEILKLAKKKRLTKKDKENLEIILKGSLFRTDFINGDQDLKEVRAEKQASIDLLMKELQNGKK